jgi:glucose-6-phosphate 1-dehydrogenase
MAPASTDALVIFGITGDLAKVMTFRSLYRLERSGVLDFPIVGVAVDDWSLDDLASHARAAITDGGETIDDAVFRRLVDRFAYVQGDFADAATFQQVGKELGGRQRPLFYLEIPPALFGPVVAQLAAAGLTDGARILIEKPFGHDLASARALAAELHRSVEESQLYRVDHYLGKLGFQELLYLRFANPILEAVWNGTLVSELQITMAESFGVEDRGHFYDPVGALRDVVVNHLLQLLAVATMEAPSAPGADALNAARLALFRAVGSADPARYVRGQYEGYTETPGVAPGSQTETFAALELRIENERWAGVPVAIRTGKHLAVTETEVRLRFRAEASPAFLGTAPALPVNELVVRLDPSAGVCLVVDAHRADADGPAPIQLDMTFATEGGDGPTPYEVLLSAAIAGDRSLFTNQEVVEEAWRIVQPLLDVPPPVQPYEPGTLGPSGADALAQWAAPWTDEPDG